MSALSSFPTASAGVSSFCQQAWDQVFSKVKRAVVFMDSACAESLHWTCGGAGRLLQAGALNVKEFSSFESGGTEQPKAVFVVSTLLKGRTVDIIRDIVSLSNFQYSVVFTAVSHAVHLQAHNASGGAESDSGNRVVFEQFEEKLCQWMGNMNYTAEVQHVALFLVPISPRLFIVPAFSSLFSLMAQDLSQINDSRPEKKKIADLSHVDFSSLSVELQLEIRTLVSGLNTLFEYLGMREECFAVGPLSRIIAGDLANYSQAKTRRKTAQSRASVIFVDRTLDLTGAVGHHGDNLAEKILSVLPKLPGHANDVMVNMVELTALQTDDASCSVVAPGCLAQPADPTAKALWESLMNLKHKEAVMEVRRHLVEAASREDLPIKMSMGRVTPEQLASFIQLFKSKSEAVENHSGLLQIAQATVQTLKHPQNAKWDNFLAFERLLMQNLSESALPGVLKQLLPIIKSHNSRSDDDYTPEDLLVLLVYIYSIAGEVNTGKELDEAEGKVKESLVRSMCDEPELSTLLQKITGCESSLDLTCQKATVAVNKIFKVLRDITRARANMKQFNSVHIPGSDTQQASYKPLLKQLMEEIYKTDRPDPVDIEHMSSGLTDLLKTGFSMFMKVSRPHPRDHPLLILFMVGGVTVSEVKVVKEVLSAHRPGTQVIVLSSTLLTPVSILELIFTTDHLQPDIGI
ncbi:sec1 family domain-containing protein 2 [Eublepharis macularius]|uniref:Sec1 family domain-containing protein 2 n=1 Tax=Eublepharis macularius TaxID=481883 RepID=A0AA97JZ21_EUBMA|nr:sec1 family domain-containing protein 2 [Eublepharis macularius]